MESAIAGVMSIRGVSFFEGPDAIALRLWSSATEIYESCQVRNEAALSGTFRVLKGCLDRANCIGNVCGYQFEAGRTAFVIKMLLVAANLGMSGRFVMLACKKLYDIPKLSCEAGT